MQHLTRCKILFQRLLTPIMPSWGKLTRDSIYHFRQLLSHCRRCCVFLFVCFFLSALNELYSIPVHQISPRLSSETYLWSTILQYRTGRFFKRNRIFSNFPIFSPIFLVWCCCLFFMKVNKMSLLAIIYEFNWIYSSCIRLYECLITLYFIDLSYRSK